MVKCCYSIFIFLCISCQTAIKRKIQPEDLIFNIKKTSLASSPERTLSAKQVKEDLDYLSYALSHAWAVSWLKPVEVKEALDKIKAISEQNKSRTSQSLYKSIHKIISLVPDNHTHVSLRGVSKFNYIKGKVGLNLIAGSDKAYLLKSVQIDGDNIIVLAIKHFPSFQDKIWDEIKTNFSNLLAKSKGLIIDIRDHGKPQRGGDNNPAFFIAKTLWGKKPNDHGDRFNITTLQALALTSNSPEEYEQKKLKHKSLLSYVDKSLYLSPKETSKDLGKNGYKHPIAILTDGFSRSSDEELVATLKDHPKVIVVGQNTSGTYHFGNAHSLLLPNSNIKVSISTMFKKHRDNSFIEKTGFPPDIKLSDGTDAFNHVNKNWETLKKITKKVSDK
jgi:hypothetical protein